MKQQKDVDAERSKHLISQIIFFLWQPPQCNFCCLVSK